MSEEKYLDAKIYLDVMKILIQKYGNFKVSPELHNKIIKDLAEICEQIEECKK